MLRSVFVGLFVALSCYPALSAQPPAHVWELQEIELRASRPYANPYVDLECWVELKGPGFSKRVYGFWDGGDVFRVRLVATAPGQWSCLPHYSLTAEEFNEAINHHYRKYGPMPFGQPVTSLIDHATDTTFGTGAYDVTSAAEPPGARPYFWQALRYESAEYMRGLGTFILSEGPRYRDLQLASDDLSPRKATGSSETGLDGWSFLMRRNRPVSGWRQQRSTAPAYVQKRDSRTSVMPANAFINKPAAPTDAEVAAALGLPEPALGNQWEDAPCSLVYRCGSHACFS